MARALASIVLLLACGFVRALDYSVCTNGCTHTTIAEAVAVVGPGDTVEIQADEPGGSRTHTDAVCLDLTNVAGASGQEITFRVRAGDRITFDCSTYGVLLENTSFVIIDGTDTDRGSLQIGDVTDWAQSDGGRGYNQDQGIYVKGESHHFEFRNLTFYGGSRYNCNQVVRQAHHYRFSNVRGDLCGTNNDTATGLDRGDLIHFDGYSGLVENSEFTHGGHNGAAFFGPHIVARNNIFDGGWSDTLTGYPGARAAIFTPGNKGEWTGTGLQTTYGPQLVENNVFRNNGTSVDQTGNSAFKLQGFGVIIRGNYAWDSGGHWMLGPGYQGIGKATGEVMSRGHVYQNTVYDTYGVWRNDDGGFKTPMGSANQQLFAFKNNLFDQVRTGTTNANATLWDANSAGRTGMLNGHTNSWKGSVWESNNFSGPSTAMRFKLTGVAAATRPVTDSATWPANVLNNTNVTPTWVDAGARTKAGLALSATSAVGIDDATHLTTATDAGADETTLTLGDAYYFYDGANPLTWDLAYFGETGDCIAVGATSATTAVDATVTQIVSIDYASGATVVSPGVAHEVGSKVWWAQKNADGTCGAVADNRGASQ